MENTGKIKLVLCDDHDLVRQGLRDMLERCPEFEVVGEASDGLQALDVVESHQPDVVLCDIRMPGLNGVEVVRRLKESNPQTRVMALSAYDDDEYVSELVQAGAAGYLMKTADAGELTQAIKAAYHGETVIHPTIAAKLPRLWSQTTPASRQGLTQRETEILRLAADGLPNKAIAAKLKLSIRTVEAYLGRIYSKMRVDSRSKAINYAYSKQILEFKKARFENSPGLPDETAPRTDED